MNQFGIWKPRGSPWANFSTGRNIPSAFEHLIHIDSFSKRILSVSKWLAYNGPLTDGVLSVCSFLFNYLVAIFFEILLYLYCTIFMCHFSRVALYWTRYTFIVLHYFHVALLSCFTVFMWHDFCFALFLCCTFFGAAVSLCCTFSIFFFFPYCTLFLFCCFFHFSRSLRAAIFSCCTFFMLHSVYVALCFH